MAGRGLGIAFDIGTTTLVASLLDLEGGKGIRSSILNPQIRYGRDVLTRIEACRGADGLEVLHLAVIEGVNRLIERLLNEGVHTFGTDREGLRARVEMAAFAGNSVMEHILLKVSPLSIGKAPYKPAFKEGRKGLAGDLGLHLPSRTPIYTFPLVGGFVGGDAVAFMLYLDLHRERGPIVALDLGTNTEIMLKTPEGIWATSAPAGPAFEGGNIGWGMVAEEGAISGVRIGDERVEIDVIGGVAPRGICGSGLIEAVSEMLLAGILDRDGRMKGRDEIDTNIANRVKGDGERTFVLYRDARGEITLSQKDLREFQVAKASVEAGIRVLLKRRGVSVEEVEKVYVTGAFGSHISPVDLGRLGIIPMGWRDRVEFVEDGPLHGVEKVLIDPGLIDEAEGVARGVHYLPLSGNPLFEREFIGAMEFREWQDL